MNVHPASAYAIIEGRYHSLGLYNKVVILGFAFAD
jgi:hypothetical protein